MDERNTLNQDTGKSEKILQLEKELEEIKNRVKYEHQFSLTQSPLREKALTSLSVTESSSFGESYDKAGQEKPTYVEEENLSQVTKLGNLERHEQIKIMPNLVGRKTSLNTFFWIGIGFMTLSLLAGGAFLILNLLR